MSDPAIRAESLGKVFRVWRHPRDMLREILTGRVRHSEFEALHDISFDVRRGSVVGVMGRNGAGKSTLLRIIAGTLDATSGSVSVSGRISAILELGTGFHPENTGRENVFLGGLCLGLTRREIASRLDEIVSFAELEDFIDQPFRTYSSGMQARLTFAVATAVDPDILIIDEALAVGDARFRLKSFDRVRRFRRDGKSILLVSHDINQIVSICDYAILLEKGRIYAQGEPGIVSNIYHELLFGPKVSAREALSAIRLVGAPPDQRADEAEYSAAPTASDNGPEPPQATTASFSSGPTIASNMADAGNAATIECRLNMPVEQPGREHRYGSGAVRIVDFFIREMSGARVSRITSLQRYEFVMYLQAMADAPKLGVGILVRTPRGIEVFGANTFLFPEIPARDMMKGDQLSVRVPFVANLGHGTYFASAVVANSDSVKYDARFDALQFTVARTGYHDASLTNLDPRFIYEQSTAPIERIDNRSMANRQ